MLFNFTTRTRKVVATLVATGLLGGSAAGAFAVAHDGSAVHADAAATTTSTVPKPLTRTESAAEDVIGYLEAGRPAKSRAAARLLRDLAHGATADALRHAGVPEAKLAALRQRADRTARLSLGGADALRVSQAANSVSQLMPGFYARYQDPVPPAVLQLDYLDRQVQLDAQAHNRAGLRHTVRRLDATWQQLRPELVAARGQTVVKAYDRHVTALERGGTSAAIQQQAVNGLEIVDQMEAVFLGK